MLADGYLTIVLHGYNSHSDLNGTFMATYLTNIMRDVPEYSYIRTYKTLE